MLKNTFYLTHICCIRIWQINDDSVCFYPIIHIPVFESGTPRLYVLLLHLPIN